MPPSPVASHRPDQARRGTAAGRDSSATGQLILFGGGAQNAVYFNDTWTWNGSNWVQLHPATSPPFGFASAMA